MQPSVFLKCLDIIEKVTCIKKKYKQRMTTEWALNIRRKVKEIDTLNGRTILSSSDANSSFIPNLRMLSEQIKDDN